MAELSTSKDKKKYFFNRELSWIEFNRRVLAEAQDQEKPLLERLKFIAIVSSNFDEFFAIRVASIRRQYRNGNYIVCPTGLSPEKQLLEISKRINSIISEQYDCLLNEIMPGLNSHGLVFHTQGSFNEEQKEYLRIKFKADVFPVLTPVRFHAKNPAGIFGNLRLHIAFLLEKKTEEKTSASAADADNETTQIAIVQIPSSLKRIIFLPEQGEKLGYTFLETLICDHADDLFPGYLIKEHLIFRTTRDADVGVDESRDEDFVEALEKILCHRDLGNVVRLNVSKTSELLKSMIADSLGLEHYEIFEVEQPLDPSIFMEIASIKGYDHLKAESWRPVESIDFSEDVSIFDSIKEKDILLMQPYESFKPVVRLIEEAADDPEVLAIKMTLYRTSGDSPIVKALERAAQNGKHVTVLVELKARFDEARNISWAERLNAVGVVVIYGVVGLKVHAKALLIIRKENEGIRRYLHLSTGNYNDKTAKLYSDLSLFTSKEDFCYEAGQFFNAITGYSVIPVLGKLSMAPTVLKARLLQLIDREIQKSSVESPGLIIAKMNAVVDVDLINSLYIANQVNVQVILIIRGICLLVPGLAGKSENIRVFSILDRVLEHTRACYFKNGGLEEVYASSADWMPRNLDGRIELMFSIDDKDLKTRVKDMLFLQMADNAQSWELKSNGSYLRRTIEDSDEQIRSQEQLYHEAVNRNHRSGKSDRREFRVRRTSSD